jgi:hypothetical protein
MTTENTDYEAHEGGARIEDLPASDMQMRSEDRERSSRQPPDEGDPEDIAVPAEPGDPEDPEDFQRESPPPRDPDDE